MANIPTTHTHIEINRCEHKERLMELRELQTYIKHESFQNTSNIIHL